MGYPCPDTMELTPGMRNSRSSNGMIAECRCPPGTAQSFDSTTCYKLYEQGPCDIGQFFAPVNEPSNTAMYVFAFIFRIIEKKNLNFFYAQTLI